MTPKTPSLVFRQTAVRVHSLWPIDVRLISIKEEDWWHHKSLPQLKDPPFEHNFSLSCSMAPPELPVDLKRFIWLSISSPRVSKLSSFALNSKSLINRATAHVRFGLANPCPQQNCGPPSKKEEKLVAIVCCCCWQRFSMRWDKVIWILYLHRVAMNWQEMQKDGRSLGYTIGWVGHVGSLQLGRLGGWTPWHLYGASEENSRWLDVEEMGHFDKLGSAQGLLQLALAIWMAGEFHQDPQKGICSAGMTHCQKGQDIQTSLSSSSSRWNLCDIFVIFLRTIDPYAHSL